MRRNIAIIAAVVTKGVPKHELVVGTPARQIRWVSEAGERTSDYLVCPRDGSCYAERDGQQVLLEV